MTAHLKQTTRLARRWRQGWLVVALVALVALAGCGSATAKSGGVTLYPTLPVPTETATAAATATPTGSAWTTVSDASQMASIAPAALRTRYDVFSGQDSKTSPAYFRLRRSDDFGQTWTNLTPPQIPGVSYPANIGFVTGVMSPLNPKVYILTLQLYNAPCPSGSRHCQTQYVTTDGGATWSQITLPASGLLGAHSPISIPRGMAPLAQGTRLYSFLSAEQLAASGVVPSGRLVVSNDGGVTWSFADAQLAARNLAVYAFTAAPSGSTVYALAGAPLDTTVPGPLPPLSLWRSDDAGATWTATGPLPAGSLLDLLAVNDQLSGTLYVLAGASTQTTGLFASHTGGATWIHVADLSASSQASYGTRLIAGLSSVTGDVTLDVAGVIEVWNPRYTTPRAMTQSSGLYEPAATYFQPLASGTRIWLYGQGNNGPIYEYTTLDILS